MVKKILCAVDDTEHSKKAVEVAAQLATATGAELTLLAVDQLMGGYGKGGAVAVYLWDDAQLKGILDNATAAAKKAGVSDPRIASAKSRDAARAIVVFAENEGVDHIVVGTGGKGGISQLRLGSVSRDVVSRAHCPVTVAR